MPRIDWKTLEDVFRNVRLTFSMHCHSGLIGFTRPGHQCSCWRCKGERGEPYDTVTEMQAACDQADAQFARREALREAAHGRKEGQ